MPLRMTHQTKIVLEAARELGHATNADILKLVRTTFPELSATTVHRITARMVTAGLLNYGPDINGSKTIDANTFPHDHFICETCDGIKDITISEKSRKEIQSQVDSLVINSQLTITGECTQCVY
jgi:Fe2+ or Zn2+ uptake regulation protein